MVSVPENNSKESKVCIIQSITYAAKRAGSTEGLRPPVHLVFQSKYLAVAWKYCIIGIKGRKVSAPFFLEGPNALKQLRKAFDEKK